MIIKFQDKKYEATYDAKTNTMGVENPDQKIAQILKEDRVQRGLLLGYLLNNPFYNLDEQLKNPLL